MSHATSPDPAPTDQLGLVFGALADATRRTILERLTGGEVSVTALTAGFAMSQPAISKHLRVLERAGLISRSKQGAMRISRLEAGPLAQASAWLLPYREYWEESFDRLDQLLADERDAAEPDGADPRTTSTSRPPSAHEEHPE